jgi:hypothetical protein
MVGDSNAVVNFVDSSQTFTGHSFNQYVLSSVIIASFLSEFISVSIQHCPDVGC